MDVENVIQPFLAVLFLIGAFFVGASLSGSERLRPDWVMFWGALVATAGVGWFALAFSGAFPLVEDELVFVAVGFVGFGALLFSMAFLYDQLQMRRIVAMNEQMRHLPREGGRDE